jgi:hypothetical protein
MRFSAEEAVAVQRAMRAELGLGPEAFPLPAFVGMISDEIDQLRAAGRSDEEVAALIARTIGREVSAGAISAHYASRGERGR